MSIHDPQPGTASGDPQVIGADEESPEPGQPQVQADTRQVQSDAELPSRDELAHSLAETEARLEEQRNAVLRAHADMDNLRKRLERDLENAHKFALERFVQELLPVKDSLELGLSAASEEVADAGRLREGTELTLKMLASAVEKFGVREVNPQGEAFDPDLHQAMSTVEDTDMASGTVVSVVQKGYVLNDRLVRPALVMVAK